MITAPGCSSEAFNFDHQRFKDVPTKGLVLLRQIIDTTPAAILPVESTICTENQYKDLRDSNSHR
jgi:hypothetical protein